MSNESYSLFSDDQPLDATWPRPYAGIDEAGRGCLSGPVVAGAVILPQHHTIKGLTDSKKLTEKKREALFPVIQQEALAWGIGLVWPKEIDRINILQATFLAMSRAVRGLHLAPQLLAIDGNQRIPDEVLAQTPECSELGVNFNMFENFSCWDCTTDLPVVCYKESFAKKDQPKPSPLAQTTIVKGDLKVPAISAASILAKTFRDRIMIRLEETYAGYGFAKHKGYGTKDHMAAIQIKGPCPQHRMTFGGVRPKTESSVAAQGSLL